ARQGHSDNGQADDQDRDGADGLGHVALLVGLYQDPHAAGDDEDPDEALEERGDAGDVERRSGSGCLQDRAGVLGDVVHEGVLSVPCGVRASTDNTLVTSIMLRTSLPLVTCVMRDRCWSRG